ncbi:MAG: DUF1501 domain-containing protein [Opitutales bacterium]
MSHTSSPLNRGRRDFFRQAACSAIGVGGIVNSLTLNRLIASGVTGFNDNSYKALVTIFLGGGNDGFNMLVPKGDPSSDDLRLDYENAREAFQLSRESLHTLNVSPTTDAFKRHYGSALPEMGVHPSCPEIANIFNSGDLAFICNTGSLAYPILNRAEFQSGNVPKPPKLFSHSNQSSQWKSSIADKPFTSGWGGRVAELINGSYNDPNFSKVAMSVSLVGVNAFMNGGANATISPYSVNKNGNLESLLGFGTDYASALDANGNYKDTTNGQRYEAFREYLRLSRTNIHEKAYRDIMVRALDTEAVMRGAFDAADATAVDFDAHFAGAQNSLGDQLKQIARLIAAREHLGNSRQLFYASVGGYDTHNELLVSHAELMSELSSALNAFRNCLIELGVFDKVVSMTGSDFGRTLKGNNPQGGTGHAWGSHAIAMGGPVNGGDLYGHYPDMKMGELGTLDVADGRGRMIPEVSVDQYAAVAANWFGVGSSELDAIFPNLGRFDDPLNSSTANMAYIG